MPSEATVILVATLVAPKPTLLLLLVAVAAAGAMGGDRLGYLVGQLARPGFVAKLARGERGRRMHDWAREQLRRNGDSVVLTGRYLPAGRMASMIVAGVLGLPGMPLPRRRRDRGGRVSRLLDRDRRPRRRHVHRAAGHRADARVTVGPALTVLVELGRRTWTSRLARTSARATGRQE